MIAVMIEVPNHVRIVKTMLNHFENMLIHASNVLKHVINMLIHASNMLLHVINLFLSLSTLQNLKLITLSNFYTAFSNGYSNG